MFKPTIFMQNYIYIFRFSYNFTQFDINFSRQENQIDVLYVLFNSWDSQVLAYIPSFHFSFTVPLIKSVFVTFLQKLSFLIKKILTFVLCMFFFNVHYTLFNVQSFYRSHKNLPPTLWFNIGGILHSSEDRGVVYCLKRFYHCIQPIELAISDFILLFGWIYCFSLLNRWLI